MTSMPAWKYLAISWQEDTMKLMSGSLVLRRGVGTQMLMVSSASNGGEIGGGAQFAGVDDFGERGAGDVADVGIAGVDAVDLVGIDVDSDHVETRLGELHGQRQANVAQAHHARRGRCASGSYSQGLEQPSWRQAQFRTWSNPYHRK